MRPKQKKPLYRKVNTRARNVHHKFGQDYSKSKRTKRPDTSMKRGVRRGLDHTPLYKFLLSKVGQDWTPRSCEETAATVQESVRKPGQSVEKDLYEKDPGQGRSDRPEQISIDVVSDVE